MPERREVYLANCCACGDPFSFFDPDRVPSVVIDPVTGLPPDMGGDPTRAQKTPICPPCFGQVERKRKAAGKAPWPTPAGDWPPEYAEALAGRG